MDLFFKGFFAIQLFFLVFAFAGTTPWAFSIFQGCAFILSAMLLFRRGLILTKPFKAAAAAFLFLIVYTLIQACFTTTILDPVPNFPATLMRLYTLDHAALFLTWLALFVIGSNIAGDFKSNKVIIWIIIIPAVIITLLHIAVPGLYLKTLIDFNGGIGPFINRNHGGCFLSVSAILCATLSAVHFAGKNKYLAENKRNEFYAKQILFLFLFFFLAFAAVFTRSRGTMLALFTGAFVYSLFLAYFFLKNRAAKITAIIMVLILFFGGVFFALKEKGDINAFAHRTSSRSVDIRKDLYTSALKALKERPLFGTGIGAMPIMITNYTQPLREYIERLHSDPLEILLGAGIAGTLPPFLLTLLFFLLALKRLKYLPLKKQVFYSGLICALISFCISSAIDFPLFIPACACVVFILAGMLCGVSFYRENYSRISIKLWLKIIILAVFCLTFYYTLQKAIAWRYYYFANGFKYEGKVEYYQKALRYYPSPRYALRLGVEYYNKSLDKKLSPEEKSALKTKAHDLAQSYLIKYPREKELSRLYINTL